MTLLLMTRFLVTVFRQAALKCDSKEKVFYWPELSDKCHLQRLFILQQYCHLTASHINMKALKRANVHDPLFSFLCYIVN